VRPPVEPKAKLASPFSVTLRIVMDPQLLMLKLPGPTRSFICAVPELPEERLTAYALPKDSHWLGEKTPAAVRLMPASPNSLMPGSDPPTA
jgi:hypothetical protein